MKAGRQAVDTASQRERPPEKRGTPRNEANGAAWITHTIPIDCRWQTIDNFRGACLLQHARTNHGTRWRCDKNTKELSRALICVVFYAAAGPRQLETS